ncbi:MAG: hypothetical protein C4334_05390 [Pyrinomonas sp.]|uniref:HDIG domain-containing metalloprotein n=1 Tax=Pyrinomonas sp. TaxID=2080306 RepID=UPI0033229FEE
MKNELRRLIPEFDLIEDEGLRERVCAVWEEAIAEGGWTLDDLARMPFTLMADNVPIGFIEHVRTVCQMCVAIQGVLERAYGERIRIDRDVLVAGALLADVGKLIEYEKRDGEYVRSAHGRSLRHPFTGVGLCYRHGIPPAVMHVVATHSKEGEHVARSPESVIFHHADFIDFDLVSEKRPF